MKKYFLIGLLLMPGTKKIHAQQNDNGLWHGIKRTIHYQPQGNDFILYKGTRKFNRALYGTNTAFRVQAGDLPEFAMYMPGMGGNCKIGISVNAGDGQRRDRNRRYATPRRGHHRHRA